jgi:ATP-dependent DNA helicase RecQ
MFEKIAITPHLILQKFFGHSKFREGQLEVINNILDKKDTLAVMPTGGGKSICFQIPSLIFSQNKNNPKVTIVVSPLISLMKDQVDSLNSKGISACYLNSSLSKTKRQETLELIKLKKIKLIYISPERLKSEEFIRVIKKIKIGMIVIDESHCISQWGSDFRPSYKEISNFYQYINKGVVKVAFTATANKVVQKDICKTLDLKNPFLFLKSFSRKNLNLEIIKCENETIKNLALIRIINKHKNQSGIIYCSTRKTTENLVGFLQKYNISTANYHGAIKKNKKEMIQNAFINGNQKLIIATNAFGMGIDKADIRFVVHYQIPGNIENYYQEIGRAGRDEKDSDCYCLYYKNDIKIQKYFIKGTDKQKKLNIEKLKKMIDLLETKKCRMNSILKYFGEIPKNNCTNCDNCKKVTNKNKAHTKHPLLVKTSIPETLLIKKLIKQKYKYKKPTNFLTDKEICYLSLAKPKNKIDCMKIPGLGKGWVDAWWKTVSPIINNNDKIQVG